MYNNLIGVVQTHIKKLRTEQVIIIVKFTVCVLFTRKIIKTNFIKLKKSNNLIY